MNTKQNVKRLFDEQIARLEGRGVPQFLTKTLRDKRDDVVDRTCERPWPMCPSPFMNHLPFLPVIPRQCMDIKALSQLMRHGDDVTILTLINPNEIKDMLETPKTPYYILGVEDGSDYLGLPFETATEILRRENRFCLTTEEIIALGTHTDVLSGHEIFATGSRRMNDDDEAPHLSADGETLILSWNDVGHRPGGRWSWPSYKLRS